MTLKPEEDGPIPDATSQIARAAFPKGNVVIVTDHDTAPLQQLLDIPLAEGEAVVQPQ